MTNRKKPLSVTAANEISTDAEVAAVYQMVLSEFIDAA